MTMTGTVWTTGRRVPGWVSEPGDDVNGRELVRKTFGLLVGRTWVILTTVVRDGTYPGSCPCEPDGDGGDVEFLPGSTVGVDVVLKRNRK